MLNSLYFFSVLLLLILLITTFFTLDLYLLVENLRLYLESEEIQALSSGGGVDKTIQYPLSLGLPFLENGRESTQFNTGGSGYTLNKAALKYLVVKAPSGYLRKRTSAEDVMVSTILAKVAGVPVIDTRDEYGDQRYHHCEVSHNLLFCFVFSFEFELGLLDYIITTANYIP